MTTTTTTATERTELLSAAEDAVDTPTNENKEFVKSNTRWQRRLPKKLV
jgi:hypothetical protein